jgi:hypothetical protein
MGGFMKYICFDVKIWLAVKQLTCFAQKQTFNIDINPLDFLMSSKLCKSLINKYPILLLEEKPTDFENQTQLNSAEWIC